MSEMAIYQQLTIQSLVLWPRMATLCHQKLAAKLPCLSRQYMLAESQLSFTYSIWWVGSPECREQEATQPENHKYQWQDTHYKKYVCFA
jgi:hypothetical protein